MSCKSPSVSPVSPLSPSLFASLVVIWFFHLLDQPTSSFILAATALSSRCFHKIDFLHSSRGHFSRPMNFVFLLLLINSLASINLNQRTNTIQVMSILDHLSQLSRIESERHDLETHTHSRTFWTEPTIEHKHSRSWFAISSRWSKICAHSLDRKDVSLFSSCISISVCVGTMSFIRSARTWSINDKYVSPFSSVFGWPPHQKRTCCHFDLARRRQKKYVLSLPQAKILGVISPDFALSRTV